MMLLMVMTPQWWLRYYSVPFMFRYVSIRNSFLSNRIHPAQQKNNDIWYAVSSFIYAHSTSHSPLYTVFRIHKNFKSMKRAICTNLVSFPFTILHSASDSNSTASTTIDFKLATAFGVGCWLLVKSTHWIYCCHWHTQHVVLPKKLLTWINANVSILHWSGFCYLSFQSFAVLWHFSKSASIFYAVGKSNNFFPSQNYDINYLRHIKRTFVAYKIEYVAWLLSIIRQQNSIYVLDLSNFISGRWFIFRYWHSHLSTCLIASMLWHIRFLLVALSPFTHFVFQ